MLKSFIFEPKVVERVCATDSGLGSWVQAAARFLLLAPVRGHTPVNQEPLLVGSLVMAPSLLPCLPYHG